MIWLESAFWLLLIMAVSLTLGWATNDWRGDRKDKQE